MFKKHTFLLSRIGVVLVCLTVIRCSDREIADVSREAEVKKSQRLNIVWLVAEDLSAIIPPFGDMTVMTPNLSRLAAEGIRFTQVYSTSGVCAPSRAAIATGMYQNRIGAQHMRTTNIGNFGVEGLTAYEAVPPAHVKMHSQYFREAGYYTSNNAKEDYQFQKSLVAWDDSSDSAHWRNRNEDQPFFSVFNFGITHESQVWRQSDKPLLIPSALDVPIPPYLQDTDISRGNIRQVYSNVVAMDRQVGEILTQLEEDGLLDSTVIFWYTDHGGPLPRQKRLLYDSGIHVPLIIRFPDGVRAGDIDEQLVSFVDFKSTALSLAGIEPPQYVDGRAFLGDYVNTPNRRYIHAAADRFDSEYDMIRAVRDARFKYLRNFNPEKPYYLPLAYREQMPIMQELLKLRDNEQLNEAQAQWFRASKDEEELFDTLYDPHELVNLAKDPIHAEKLFELRNELDEWVRLVDDKGLMSEGDLIVSMWPGGIQPITSTPVATKRRNNLEITLRSGTDGASIGYQILEEGESVNEAWTIYKEPVTINNTQRLAAVAHRLGFAPSEIITIR
ncbi:MAG: sulfatase [Gammaproteobacteria bacterium]|nr:sulfatase [Gammaproteobacteria bacterium]MDG2118668.1 sulfatase [Gammaproteobacteria bacterium]